MECEMENIVAFFLPPPLALPPPPCPPPPFSLLSPSIYVLRTCMPVTDLVTHFFHAYCSLILVVGVEGGLERCPRSGKDQGYIYSNEEKCYQFILHEKTWTQAKAFCHQRGGALANIESPQYVYPSQNQ
mgnify:CR=1 FL=1